MPEKKTGFWSAGVAELADALDLGSSAVMAWEFKSLRPHQTSGSDSVVECDLAKVEVAGSNPVFRSILKLPVVEVSRV